MIDGTLLFVLLRGNAFLHSFDPHLTIISFGKLGGIKVNPIPLKIVKTLRSRVFLKPERKFFRNLYY